MCVSLLADIEGVEPVVRRAVALDDLTLCLDRADADGRIRFYQEPLLYRCRLELRVATRLAAASSRRAHSVGVQLRSARLAWAVTGDQLALLLRLARERPAPPPPPPPPPHAPPPLSNYTLLFFSTPRDVVTRVTDRSESDFRQSWTLEEDKRGRLHASPARRSTRR